MLRKRPTYIMIYQNTTSYSREYIIPELKCEKFQKIMQFEIKRGLKLG